jgi:formate-dependent nitrite reductase cytochrome c552 subunit
LHCHSKLGKEQRAGKAYLDWKETVHAKAGVTCDNCHGGNSSASTEVRAHQGILKPSNPGSPVSSENIPKLCGNCHVPQLMEFLRSKHYRAVRETERTVQGPTCVTCHGSMHTSVPSPVNVAETCSHCHNSKSGLLPHVPEEAHATLGLIFYAKNTIQWSSQFVRMAEAKGYNVQDAAAVLKDAEQKYETSKVKWHSFDFTKILIYVDGAYDSAKKAKRLVDQVMEKEALKK